MIIYLDHSEVPDVERIAPGVLRYLVRRAELAAAHGIREIDLLPFHRLGESKYAVIQQPYTMPDATVPQEHIDALAALLRQRGFIVSIGG